MDHAPIYAPYWSVTVVNIAVFVMLSTVENLYSRDELIPYMCICDLGAAKQASNMAKEISKVREQVLALITEGRRFTIGMDCWSKKGLTASFLGISASFFHPTHKVALTFLLNLFEIEHPHTGEMIADKLQSSLHSWGIDPKKVLMVVTDNGSNMVKAVSMTLFEDDSEGTDDDDEEEEEEEEDTEDIGQTVTLHRFPCLAHTLQLVLKAVETNAAYSQVMIKARSIVKKIRVSSVATEKLIARCGMTVVTECSTRWNSNMFMIERMLKTKDAIGETLNDMKWDGLLASEWAKLDDLYHLLQPFTEHTNTMQTDNFALSNVIPVLIDLSNHLSSNGSTLAQALLRSLKVRFDTLLNPSNSHFDPIPSAACFVDPAVARIIMTPETAELLSAAKKFIVSLICLMNL